MSLYTNEEVCKNCKYAEFVARIYKKEYDKSFRPSFEDAVFLHCNNKKGGAIQYDGTCDNKKIGDSLLHKIFI